MYGGDVVVFGYVVVENSSPFALSVLLDEDEASVDVLLTVVVTVILVTFDGAVLLSSVVVAGILVEVLGVLVVVGLEVANDVAVVVIVVVVVDVVIGLLVVVGNGEVEVALEVEEEIFDVAVLFAVVMVDDVDEDVVNIAHPGIDS